MDEEKIIDGLKIICKCRNIRKKVFLDHIAGGCMEIEDLQKVTGAGTGDCRGKQCTPRIKELLQPEDTNPVGEESQG